MGGPSSEIGGSVVQNPPAKHEFRVQFLGQEDPLEEGMATHSSALVWRIPWTVESGGLGFSPQGHKESDTTERLNNNKSLIAEETSATNRTY